MEDDSFDQELKETLDDLLGEKVSDQDVQQFVHLITSILSKEAKDLINCYRKSNDVPQPNQIIPRNRPLYNYTNPYPINPYMLQNPQQNSFLYQSYQYQQPPVNPMMTRTLLSQPPPIYPQYQNPPFIANSFPFNYQPNQPAMSVPSYSKKYSHKHSKKDSHKHSKKDSQKHSKSFKKDKTKKEAKTKKKNSNVKEISYQGRDFDGIFNYLTKKTGGNIHNNGTIKITANSVNRHSINSPNPENVVDFSTENNSYKSSDDVLSWLCFDFKDQQIQLKNYSIISNNSTDFGQLRNWVIEVSNDGESWKEIDNHSSDITLKKPRYVATFSVQKNDDKDFYRYVRLRQTGRSWHSVGNGNLINIPKMEFYGNLKESI